MKANKSRIMKMAHAIYQAGTVKTWGEALRMAWAAERTGSWEERLESLGFNHWVKESFDRWYINPENLGLECGFYKNTHNLRWAYYEGHELSNRRGAEAYGCKVYAENGKIAYKGEKVWGEQYVEKARRLWDAAA